MQTLLTRRPFQKHRLKAGGPLLREILLKYFLLFVIIIKSFPIYSTMLNSNMKIKIIETISKILNQLNKC